jgi:hypothetical protein
MRSNGLRRILVLLMAVGLVLAPLAGPPATSFSAAQQLDPTFDGDGKLLSPLGNESISGQTVIVQPDQKILVVGSAFLDGDWDFALLRYCTDGSLDNGAHCGSPGFGGDFNDFAYDAAQQADGKILISGESAGHLAIARYLPTRTYIYLLMVLR